MLTREIRDAEYPVLTFTSINSITVNMLKKYKQQI